jgi:hypothetical protein
MTSKTDPEEEAMILAFDHGTYGVNRQELEEMGERAARDALNLGKFAYPGHKDHAFVSAWLMDKEFSRLEISESKRDAREAETLSIANRAADAASEANRIASESLTIARSSSESAIEQARWARWAVIIAMIAAAIATKDEIFKLIFTP